jgi:hypothetical protein
MRTLQIAVFLFGILGCVQSLDTTGFMVGRVIFPEESLTPMKIGGPEFVSQERRSDLQDVLNDGTFASNSSNDTRFESGCSDSVQCNVTWNFTEVKRFGLED